MTSKPVPSRATPRPLFEHGPITGKVLAVIGLGGLPAWFLLKFDLPSTNGVVEIASALSALGGLICGLALFVGTFGFRANAPAGLIDERQVAERDAAYLISFRSLVVLCLAGWFGAEIVASQEDSVFTAPVLRNFLLVVVFHALVMPAAVLALREPVARDADD